MGVRMLKSRLSECSRRVREGTKAQITLPDETGAGICPPTLLADNHINNELKRRAQAGKVRLGAQNRPEVYTTISVQLPTGAAQILLDESKGEY